jgi:hypothetical protein
VGFLTKLFGADPKSGSTPAIPDAAPGQVDEPIDSPAIELPALSEATVEQLNAVARYAEKAQTQEGRASALSDLKYVIESIASRPNPSAPDLLDKKFRISPKDSDPTVVAVRGASVELVRVCQSVRKHLAAVQDGEVDLRSDFDRLWLSVELAMQRLDDRIEERDATHNLKRAKFMPLLSPKDRRRLAVEALERASASLDRMIDRM